MPKFFVVLHLGQSFNPSYPIELIETRNAGGSYLLHEPVYLSWDYIKTKQGREFIYAREVPSWWKRQRLPRSGSYHHGQAAVFKDHELALRRYNNTAWRDTNNETRKLVVVRAWTMKAAVRKALRGGGEILAERQLSD